jgi:aminomethyltransferase
MLRTPLHDWHSGQGGRMVDFAGWDMPVQYTSIVEEHQAVRQRVGLFDISHMGRLRFDGAEARRFLDRLLTNDVAALQPGQVRYSLVCREDGGILDDVLVYRFPQHYALVVNASNREKIIAWCELRREPFEVSIVDETFDTCMIAVQGPSALGVLQPHCELLLSPMPYYTAEETNVLGAAAVVSRTGYTGEDGFEVIVPAERGVELWEALLSAGAAAGVLPCGLGCRDTLRLEAGMPLYGHELDESIDPLTAGLGFAVKLEAAEFVGKPALIERKARPSGQKRIGMQLEGRRIAREGSSILADGQFIGRVTSGTFSPTLQRPIAMGYVTSDHATTGAAVSVDIRGTAAPAQIVRLPFYKR